MALTLTVPLDDAAPLFVFAVRRRIENFICVAPGMALAGTFDMRPVLAEFGLDLVERAAADGEIAVGPGDGGRARRAGYRGPMP